MLKKQLIVRGLMVILVIILTVTGVRISNEKQDLQKEIESLTVQLKEQKEKNTNEIDNVNYKFMDVFFSYDKMNDRTEKSKEYLTDKGFLAAYPSGSNSSDLITSKMADLKFYTSEVNEGKYIYMNEFTQTITFGGNANEVKRIVKTELVKSGDTWKVNDIQLMN